MKQVTSYLYAYKIFNIGTVYIRMATVVANIYLSYTLYLVNVPLCGAKVTTQLK
jgi:hypothetical protein